ncbi:MAG: alpha/beta fold hydrolase [Gammaproteobacteria bacterium]|nr:alpha/beta fold hydrolase [Gammaproteobacteria bacterium]
MTRPSPLYPPLSPHHVDRLTTGDGHELHIAEFGRPDGLPVLFLHGGPGSGCNPGDARLFHPDRYRVIQVDQRGTGLSSPPGCLLGNNLCNLVEDLTRLRLHLGVHQWLVYGGSWGGTLALEYAKSQPDTVSALILRAPFLARWEDLNWYAGTDGIARQLPEAYSRLRGTLGLSPQSDLIEHLNRLLCADNPEQKAGYRAALAWDTWEAAVMGLPAPATETDPGQQFKRFNRKRIHVHYCHNDFFLDREGVLNSLNRVKEIELCIVHGTADRVCRFAGSEHLAKLLPRCRLYPVPGAGHGLSSPPLQSELIHHLDALYR